MGVPSPITVLRQRDDLPRSPGLLTTARAKAGPKVWAVLTPCPVATRGRQRPGSARSAIQGWQAYVPGVMFSSSIATTRGKAEPSACLFRAPRYLSTRVARSCPGRRKQTTRSAKHRSYLLARSGVDSVITRTDTLPHDGMGQMRRVPASHPHRLPPVKVVSPLPLGLLGLCETLLRPR